MAAIRHASAVWNGDLTHGSGMITYVSSGSVARLPVSWSARTEYHGGKTSPEELIAAAHASCFSMAFASRLAKNGTEATQLDVRCEVTFDKGESGWGITTSAITVRGQVPGIDATTFQSLAEDAKANCPVSQALKGNVTITLDAALAEG